MNKQIKLALLNISKTMHIQTELELKMIDQLRFYTQKYKRTCEAYCSDETFCSKSEEEIESIFRSIEEKIKDILKILTDMKLITLSVEFQRDPRGYTVNTNNFYLNTYINWWGNI